MQQKIEEMHKEITHIQNSEAAEKVDTTAYIWYNVIIKYRRWYHG